ncbi:hypothetical protein I302_104707 [Kwoniella bestiolae CBS 10118]|uniref:alpha-1,2-Mannosidase n=1 Tax=Kwoniella bestiolae CBS 10118 TaxID=1296100 RepID=A0A1B9FRY7_9TREE|nr:mannosyl-oligosaccharide 1,2-alpha-mannosidase [Kwoniella bestiolae CBS 10118]OCF21543.1 mannosyl-oligosaccharide 1,2-alpha-mannosidase [Kwoniella bestiolae CBS 10118]
MLSPKQNGKTMPYTPAYTQDVEKGLSSPTKIARRFVSRKPRWIVGGLILFGVVFYFYESGPPLPPKDLAPPHPPHHHGPPPGHGWSAGDEWDEDHNDDDDDDDEEEEEDEEDEDEDKGWKNWIPFGGKPKPPKVGTEPTKTSTEIQYDFVLDNNGDQYVTNWVQPIAPLHPDLSLLPPPEDLLPEINLRESSPPREEVYPDDKLRMIISPTPDNEEIPRNTIPPDAWATKWMEERRPEDWKGQKGDMKKVQWSGFARGRDNWENAKQKKEREKRRDAVKRGFKHAWEAYKRHAWGHDEVRPISQTPSDPFNGWGATIIDSLDTLLLMGFSDEYNLCRPHINQVNFHWVNGRDWSSGYITEDEDGTGEVYALPRDKGVGLPVFETGIRYLGGLLGAYDLSGDKLLVERAEDLANVLAKAFDTVSGLPAGRIDPGLPAGEQIHLSTVSIAEVGSMSLELIRLSQVTNDRKWFDLAQRAMEYLEERVIPRSTQPPLIPMWFQPDASIEHVQAGGFTFGGLADSYYEYLIKTYKLLGNNEHAEVWKKVYAESIDKAKEILYKDIEVVPDRELFTIGKFEHGRLIHELEHLTCFAGAMLGLGAKLLDGRDGDMVDAEKLTRTCYWLSADTPTGLQPEVMEWYQPHEVEMMYENVTLENSGMYRPPLSSQDIEDAVNSGENIQGTHKDMNGLLRWNNDGSIVTSRDPSDDPVQYARKLKGRPTGARKVVGRGINRPETIESIFYMYRLTGDRSWQEKGWKMFVSWMETAKVDGGVSSVDDVTKERGQLRYGDNMESFALAETFKYHFLLQSEPDILSLDDYVLNTEAHPFLVNPKLDPTSSTSHVRYWTPSSDQNLGVRSQGTNTQKFARLNVIDRIRGPARGPPVIQHFGQGGPGQGPPPPPGGGKGMGGGGGRPGDRPKPPPGFGMKKIKVGEEGGAKFPDDF